MQELLFPLISTNKPQLRPLDFTRYYLSQRAGCLWGQGSPKGSMGLSTGVKGSSINTEVVCSFEIRTQNPFLIYMVSINLGLVCSDNNNANKINLFMPEELEFCPMPLRVLDKAPSFRLMPEMMSTLLYLPSRRRTAGCSGRYSPSTPGVITTGPLLMTWRGRRPRELYQRITRKTVILIFLFHIYLFIFMNLWYPWEYIYRNANYPRGIQNHEFAGSEKFPVDHCFSLRRSRRGQQESLVRFKE